MAKTNSKTKDKTKAPKVAAAIANVSPLLDVKEGGYVKLIKDIKNAPSQVWTVDRTIDYSKEGPEPRSSGWQGFMFIGKDAAGEPVSTPIAAGLFRLLSKQTGKKYFEVKDKAYTLVINKFGIKEGKLVA